MKKYIIAFLFWCLFQTHSIADLINPADDIQLPDGFVYLHHLDSSIITDVRYASNNNPLGRPIKGYNRAVVILTQEAAEALKSVQLECRERGYSLVVYDAYRPLKSIADIVDWAKDLSDQKTKQYYYPSIQKADLLNKYINEKSTHSRGSSVDVTIIPMGKNKSPINAFQRLLNDGREITFQDDGTLDMGTSYDLFDESSSHSSTNTSPASIENKKLLKDLMTRHGFKPKEDEWWHYTLTLEPYPDTCFDFDVE